MSGIYLFNPWNDLALANFTPNYTPPASAVRLADELALLPAWYAGGEPAFAAPLLESGSIPAAKEKLFGGDCWVVAEGVINRSYLESVKQLLPLQASITSFSEIASFPCLRIIPWGWNPSLRKRLISLGVEESGLPSQQTLSILRNYSNRRHAVEILRELKSEQEYFYGESHFFTAMEELHSYLSSTSGDKVLKMPLSGSGKGLIRILGGITDKQQDWCRRVIKEQGGVVAEPLLQRKQDLAMEFYLHKGDVRFTGYSLFGTTASGAYTGNQLLGNSQIEARIGQFVPSRLLWHLRESLSEKLAKHFPLYDGYVGVDMMVCDTPEGYRLHPCVEINMRMTMGMVARIFYDRYLLPEAEGQFVIDYFKESGGALEFHEKMQKEYPLKVEKGTILSGYLSLTPVVQTTRYIAFVKVR